MLIMTKAQECLIKCLRISGMSIAQIIKTADMLEEEATLEMLQQLTENPTLDHNELHTIACEISQKYKREEREVE